MSGVTVVTALFDIGRGDLLALHNNKRSFQTYLEWFSHLLEIECNLEVWTTADVAAIVRRRRAPETTVVHVAGLKDLPMHDRREDMRRAMAWTSQGSNFLQEHIEFMLPDYNVINFSKAGLLRRAATANVFGSTRFLWIDAGAIRTADARPRGRWPDPYKVASLGDLFLFAKDFVHRGYAEAALSDVLGFVRRHENPIRGYVFGGTGPAVVEWAARIDVATDSMLRAEAMNNDQSAMLLAAAAAWDDVRVLPIRDDGWAVLPRYILGTETPIMPWPYHRAQGLLAASYNDSGVREHELEYLVESAAYFGYDLSLLGRGAAAVPAAQRWRRRTAAYLGFVRGAPPDSVVLLCDGTDVFFAASAAEFLDVFVSLRASCVIGAEAYVAYAEVSTSKRSQPECERLLGRCGRPACFPNGGLVAGRACDLLRLLEANAESEDDQAGFYDLILDGHARDLLVDSDSKLFGNVPRWPPPRDQPGDVWFFQGRFRHKLSGNRPCVLHFPGHGKESYVQKDFFHKLWSWSPPSCVGTRAPRARVALQERAPRRFPRVLLLVLTAVLAVLTAVLAALIALWRR
jgi:hypothetical protein